VLLVPRLGLLCVTGPQARPAVCDEAWQAAEEGETVGSHDNIRDPVFPQRHDDHWTRRRRDLGRNHSIKGWP
jgi:hypothetical protein